jgi:hypothetical protein
MDTMNMIFKNSNPVVFLMTRKILFLLLTVVVAVGVISPAFAVSMEDVTHVVYGDELKTMMEFGTNAVIHFTGNPDGLKGFELYDKSKAPHTSNCQSGWNADEYSVCIFETKNMELGYHEWFDRTTDTWGKFYIYQANQVSTSTSDYQAVSQKAKDFKAQIEAKMNEKLKPLQTEITELKLQLSNAGEREVLYQSQVATIKAELTTAQDNVISAQSSIAELQTANASIEQYKKDAENWKAVALEQLKVMAEVLGLF